MPVEETVAALVYYARKGQSATAVHCGISIFAEPETAKSPTAEQDLVAAWEKILVRWKSESGMVFPYGKAPASAKLS